MTSNTFNFNDFINANPSRRVSGFDYLRAIYITHGLPADFLFWMTELVCPTFIEVDGMAFVSVQFDRDEYEKLLQDGKTPQEAQFWMNLLEISGLFDELTVEENLRFAQSICASWNMTLQLKFPEDKELAKIIHDQDTNEVFIVVGRRSEDRVER